MLVIYQESFKAQSLLYAPTNIKIKMLRSAHTLYLCVFYKSLKKERYFPSTSV